MPKSRKSREIRMVPFKCAVFGVCCLRLIPAAFIVVRIECKLSVDELKVRRSAPSPDELEVRRNALQSPHAR